MSANVVQQACDEGCRKREKSGVMTYTLTTCNEVCSISKSCAMVLDWYIYVFIQVRLYVYVPVFFFLCLIYTKIIQVLCK